MSIRKTVTTTTGRVTKITPMMINISPMESMTRYSNKKLGLCQQTESNIILKGTI
jgi:hypothetical protein